jgi:hypothetical protein
MNSVAAYLEAFGIFAKYGAEEWVQIDQDDGEYLEVFVDPDMISKTDKSRLRELGWYIDASMASFYHV